MTEVRVHNYAFRKALAYVRNKRGKKISEKCKEIFENTIHQKLSTKSPYLPSYYPLKSFAIFLQIINKTLGENEKTPSLKKANRYQDLGFYLYTGPSEQDSPYHYLDPHKPLPDVLNEFYANLQTASGIFRDCGTSLNVTDSKIMITWKGMDDHLELFFYLEGVHLGMIKEASTTGELVSKKEKGAFVFEVKLPEQ